MKTMESMGGATRRKKGKKLQWGGGEQDYRNRGRGILEVFTVKLDWGDAWLHLELRRRNGKGATSKEK